MDPSPLSRSFFLTQERGDGNGSYLLGPGSEAKIAEYSKNSVLKSLVSLIIIGIINVTRKYDTCRDGRFRVALQEHDSVLEGIRPREPEKAAEAMAEHMRKVRIEREALGGVP